MNFWPRSKNFFISLAKLINLQYVWFHYVDFALILLKQSKYSQNAVKMQPNFSVLFVQKRRISTLIFLCLLVHFFHNIEIFEKVFHLSSGKVINLQYVCCGISVLSCDFWSRFRPLWIVWLFAQSDFCLLLKPLINKVAAVK